MNISYSTRIQRNESAQNLLHGAVKQEDLQPYVELFRSPNQSCPKSLPPSAPGTSREIGTPGQVSDRQHNGNDPTFGDTSRQLSGAQCDGSSILGLLKNKGEYLGHQNVDRIPSVGSEITRRGSTTCLGHPDERGGNDIPSTYSTTPPTIALWVHHNTKLLQEYADRQISPPLINRVSLELNHPSQFILGTFQLLSNRDKDDGFVEPTRRIPPQLLDGYVNIERWAQEYLRTQFEQVHVGNLVTTLLTIISNNFYEAHMRLMDDIVKHAIENKVVRGGSCLEVEDFAFGFDLRMSQEIPFLANVNHRVNHRVRDTFDRGLLLPQIPTTTRLPAKLIRSTAVRKTAAVSDASVPPSRRSSRKPKPSKLAQQISTQKEEKEREKAVMADLKKERENKIEVCTAPTQVHTVKSRIITLNEISHKENIPLTDPFTFTFTHRTKDLGDAVTDGPSPSIPIKCESDDALFVMPVPSQSENVRDVSQPVVMPPASSRCLNIEAPLALLSHTPSQPGPSILPRIFTMPHSAPSVVTDSDIDTNHTLSGTQPFSPPNVIIPNIRKSSKKTITPEAQVASTFSSNLDRQARKKRKLAP